MFTDKEAAAVRSNRSKHESKHSKIFRIQNKLQVSVLEWEMWTSKKEAWLYSFTILVSFWNRFLVYKGMFHLVYDVWKLVFSNFSCYLCTIFERHNSHPSHYFSIFESLTIYFMRRHKRIYTEMKGKFLFIFN